MEEVKNETVENVDFQQENVRLNYENSILKKKVNEAYQQIQYLSDQRGIERIKFLFAVVENKSGNFSPEFVTKAVEEIEETMYPKEENKDE